MNIVEQAKAFCIQAHDSIGQRRKYTNEPYWQHCTRVAEIVASVTSDEAVIAAAWLHDVLEDVAPLNADYNAEAIHRVFEERILALVLEVTDVSKPSDGNRAKRKEIDREHLKQASAQGKLIKLADLIDNFIDISENDPHFAKIFKQETLLTMPILANGNAVLFKKLQTLIKETI